MCPILYFYMCMQFLTRFLQPCMNHFNHIQLTFLTSFIYRGICVNGFSVYRNKTNRKTQKQMPLSAKWEIIQWTQTKQDIKCNEHSSKVYLSQRLQAQVNFDANSLTSCSRELKLCCWMESVPLLQTLKVNGRGGSSGCTSIEEPLHSGDSSPAVLMTDTCICHYCAPSWTDHNGTTHCSCM